MQDLLAIDPKWLAEIAPEMYQLVGTSKGVADQSKCHNVYFVSVTCFWYEFMLAKCQIWDAHASWMAK